MVLKAISLTAALLVAGWAIGTSHEADDSITVGPKAGQTIRMIRRNTVPAVQAPETGGWSVWVTLAGGITNLPLDLSAYRWECARVSNERDWPFACYEFRLDTKGGTAFVWSCWAPDFPRPHSFSVLAAAQRETYACYIGEAVHLFHLTEQRDQQLIRQKFWNRAHHPDALPVLPLDLLFRTAGETNLSGLGPQTWNITVDNLTTTKGQLTLTLHGQNRLPRYTFVLENGQWTSSTKQNGG